MQNEIANTKDDSFFVGVDVDNIVGGHLRKNDAKHGLRVPTSYLFNCSSVHFVPFQS